MIEMPATSAVLPAKNGNGALHKSTTKNINRIACDCQSEERLKFSKMLGFTFYAPK
jgi:hypothetical protein